MNFVSYAFVLLFGVVLLARLTVGRSGRGPLFNYVLLVASLVFYGWHVPAYLGLILASTAVDFWAAGAIDRIPRADVADRKRILYVSLAMNLGLLGVFKYSGLALETGRQLLDALSVPSTWIPHPEIVLPIGISFYTFQSMSYTIDVYRGELTPRRSFLELLLFVSFFPQLVAGPIVRASEFLYQLRRRRRPHHVPILEGIYLMIRGFFLKLVIADNLGPVVDYYYRIAHRDGIGPLVGFLATVLFGAQIFCDFAGYSSIARGVAYILGYRFPLNFRAPYAATSFSDFWRRWHMTLSRWLRDYLYVPLGGNRISPVRTYVNLMIVMLLGGLWHGAAWTFVIWGCIHGIGLSIERLLGLNRARRPLVVSLLWYVVVQLTVLVGWAFFRAQSFGDAVAIVSKWASLDWSLEVGTGGGSFPLFWSLLYLIPVVLIHVRTVLEERGRLPPMTLLDKGLWSGVMSYLIITCYGAGDAFIYFQF